MIEDSFSYSDANRRLCNKVAVSHTLYGGVLLLAVLAIAASSTLAVLISRETIFAIITTYLRPLVLETLGTGQGSEFVEWLLTILRFSPLLFALIAIVTSLVTGFIATTPFLATAWGLYKGKDWWRIPAVIACLMALPVFPIGSSLVLYTAYCAYKLHQQPTFYTK